MGASLMDSLDKILSDRRTRCVWLRTKAMYLNLPDPGTPETDAASACWWCLRTTDAFGPDGLTSDPSSCGRPGRSCYEGPPLL
jgi:hypothetical protein